MTSRSLLIRNCGGVYEALATRWVSDVALIAMHKGYVPGMSPGGPKMFAPRSSPMDRGGIAGGIEREMG